MDAFSTLFESHRLVFTVPLFFSLALGSLSIFGLFDLEALDLDLGMGADADLDLDAGADVDADLDPDVEAGGGVLEALGLGMIPFSLLLILLCFSFGWLGLALEFLLAGWLPAGGGGGWGLSLVLTLPALAGAVVVTAPLARLLHPLFKDYGRARSEHDLVGRPATLTSGTVSPTFGEATVPSDHGVPVDISVRTPEADHDLDRGDTVLIFDYDPDARVYFVAPYSDEHVPEPPS